MISIANKQIGLVVDGPRVLQHRECVSLTTAR